MPAPEPLKFSTPRGPALLESAASWKAWTRWSRGQEQADVNRTRREAGARLPYRNVSAAWRQAVHLRVPQMLSPS
ncbi:hypothetical protein ACWCXX_35945 [Streptomyces sp. NPDC001732]